MNQPGWSGGQAYHVRQTNQTGSSHYPLTMQVFTLHLASPFFPVKGEESTAETEMRGDFLAINKLITSVF